MPKVVPINHGLIIVSDDVTDFENDSTFEPNKVVTRDRIRERLLFDRHLGLTTADESQR